MHCWAADGDEIHEWLLCSWVWIWIMDFQNELYGHTHTHTQICTSILTRTLHWHACILTRALAKGNTHNSSPKSSLMYSRNTWSKGSMTQRHFKTEVHWGLLTASDWQVISLTGRGVYWLHLKKRVRGGRVGVGGWGKTKIREGLWRRLDLFSELKTEPLTCVSVMRRLDLRVSAPPTLLWQVGDTVLQ